MAVTKKYVVQIVIMMEQEPGQWVKDQAVLYGVSEAQIARDAIELGRDKLAAHYAKLGIRPAGSARSHGGAKRTTKRAVPDATFVAPAAV